MRTGLAGQVRSHPAVVVDAERDALGELVAHQHFHQLPVGHLVVVLEGAVGVDQRLHAGLRVGHAGGEGLLRDLHELVDRRFVLLQVVAVHDHRVAIGVQARVTPGEETHVIAQLALEDVVDVVKGRRRVDRFGLERGELGIGVDVHPGDRLRVDAVVLGERGPHRARTVTGGVADLLAGEILDALDA